MGSLFMTVRPLDSADRSPWLSMRQALWPHHDRSAHEAETAALLDRPEDFGARNYAVFISRAAGETLVGFAECSQRDSVAFAKASPVAYLEGIYVKSEHRRSGFGQELLRASEQWAKALGCAELASDAAAENLESRAFHIAMGFTVVDGALADLTYFCKSLA